MIRALLISVLSVFASLNTVITNSMSEEPEMKPVDVLVDSFMQAWHIQGASLAVMNHDRLVYAKGYGWADRGRSERMEPGHLLRLASVSKLITATGIMKLQEEGRLSLMTPVFGPFGILSEYDRYITDDNYYLMNVEHLLRHQGGFSSAKGDPMFSCLKLMEKYSLEEPPCDTTLTRCLVGEPLAFEPGTDSDYSNFGYLLLSMIIEKVTGLSYEEYIRTAILEPCGCFDFHLAGNYYEDRLPGEVRYYPPRSWSLTDDYHGNGNKVERCYGASDIRGLSGSGAWVGSTVELARFIASVNGLFGVPDILTRVSVNRMTQYIDEDTFPLGWLNVTPDGEWRRTGSFAGTNALIKCYPDGQCWILVFNTSTWKGSSLARETVTIFTQARDMLQGALPAGKDLFLTPR